MNDIERSKGRNNRNATFYFFYSYYNISVHESYNSWVLESVVHFEGGILT